MKHKRTVIAFSLLAAIGIIAFFIYEFSTVGKVRRVPPERYTGPQTVEALMAAFDEKYDRPYLDKKVDQKYPRAEWLAMCFDRGAVFGDFGDYSGLMSERWLLLSLEEKGNWVKGTRGVPPTNDWETFKATYIDRLVWEHQKIYEARQIDPEVFGGLFTGSDKCTYLPGRPDRVYVERKGSATFFHGPPLTEKQQWGARVWTISRCSYNLGAKRQKSGYRNPSQF